MADLVLRIDLGTEALLNEDDQPDRHKIAAALKWAAQRIDEDGGTVWQLNGSPIAASPRSMTTAGLITIDFG